ncbi:hypothetical protein ACROYT_G037812 [Oculina patagonica]
MAFKILIACVLLLKLVALGESNLGSTKEDVQELDAWNNGYQLDNLDMSLADDGVQDIDDTTEVKEGLYEDETEEGREKRSVKRCGPDVTSWLLRQMNRNRNHREIRRCRSWVNTVLWPRCLTKFAGLVANCRAWDYKCTQSFRRGSCPSSRCPRTVTLCGRCVNYDVPGNIHYGWVGRAATIRRWLLLYGADRVQKGGVDDPRDQNAIRIGMDQWDVPSKRSRFCREVTSRIRSLNLHGTSGCSRCSTRY